MTIRYIALILALMGIAIWFYAFTRLRRYRWAIVVPISWLLHTALFYIVRIAFPALLTPEQLNIWSTSVRLHAEILAIAGGFYAMAIIKTNGHS
jgi:hypothetical protein